MFLYNMIMDTKEMQRNVYATTAEPRDMLPKIPDQPEETKYEYTKFYLWQLDNLISKERYIALSTITKYYLFSQQIQHFSTLTGQVVNLHVIDQ